MQTAKVKAYAKINLTLDITGSKDGYHLLDSFVASVDLYDLITAKKRKDKLVRVIMRGLDADQIPYANNNAQRAGEAFVKIFQTTGAEIVVDRNIPVGGGLGGSSADTAGVLNAMAKLYGFEKDERLKQIADMLGSDTGYMLSGGFARLNGRGEVVKSVPVGGLSTMYLLLICPQTSVSSGGCYKRYDERKDEYIPKTNDCITAFLNGDLQGVCDNFSNALYLPSADLNPDTAIAVQEAKAFSPTGANMTGSGSSAYAVFETKELRDWAKSRYRGKFRTFCTQTVDPNKKKKGWKNPFALSKDEITK